jgi:hypothetical protein
LLLAIGVAMVAVYSTRRQLRYALDGARAAAPRASRPYCYYSEEKHLELEFEEGLVPTKSISVEDTFEREVLLAETETMIRSFAKLWSASREESGTARGCPQS